VQQQQLAVHDYALLLTASMGPRIHYIETSTTPSIEAGFWSNLFCFVQNESSYVSGVI